MTRIENKERRPNSRSFPDYEVDGVRLHLAPGLRRIHERINFSEKPVEVPQICSELGITKRTLQVSVSRVNQVLQNQGLPPIITHRKEGDFPGAYSCHNQPPSEPVSSQPAWYETLSHPFNLPQKSNHRL